jgi:hypothetical protein
VCVCVCVFVCVCVCVCVSVCVCVCVCVCEMEWLLHSIVRGMVLRSRLSHAPSRVSALIVMMKD